MLRAVCVLVSLCVCLLHLCYITAHTISIIIHLLTDVSVALAVGGGRQEELSTRGFLAQSALEVLELTQEVEVWGNGGPALLHKPNEETDRMWVRTMAGYSTD